MKMEEVRGPWLLLQMADECFGWYPVFKALSGLVVEDASALVKSCLRYPAEVGGRRQKGEANGGKIISISAVSALFVIFIASEIARYSSRSIERWKEVGLIQY